MDGNKSGLSGDIGGEGGRGGGGAQISTTSSAWCSELNSCATAFCHRWLTGHSNLKKIVGPGFPITRKQKWIDNCQGPSIPPCFFPSMRAARDVSGGTSS